MMCLDCWHVGVWCVRIIQPSSKPLATIPSSYDSPEPRRGLVHTLASPLYGSLIKEEWHSSPPTNPFEFVGKITNQTL